MKPSKMKELSDSDYVRIEKLSEEGNDLYEQENIRPALRKYEEALNIVPDPKTEWEASTWLYTSIADAHFSLGNIDEAKENYYNALNCPDGLSNAYIHFSLGQVLYELEESKKSQESLLRAYMLEGLEIFEDEDPKYLDSIKGLIDEDIEDKNIDTQIQQKYIYKNGSRFYKNEDGNLIEDN
ncbi:tetratricopeptide repeat protein [Lacinutrix mariniflava]|uniref:tetratricopeptide repeat protein n=1 Tax=Lacinutrix mariniflava TaxID=342955 RepID=UPI000B0B84E8|nr:tetratricopeptide repeat protein [Lacinutrix mariniflava]